MRIQLGKETRQPPVGKKVQWPGVLVFEIFSEGIIISEYARDQIRTLTLRVRWKQPRVGKIWSQTAKLTFLEIGDVPWRISMATIRRGTFNYKHLICYRRHVSRRGQLARQSFRHKAIPAPSSVRMHSRLPRD